MDGNAEELVYGREGAHGRTLERSHEPDRRILDIFQFSVGETPRKDTGPRRLVRSLIPRTKLVQRGSRVVEIDAC